MELSFMSVPFCVYIKEGSKGRYQITESLEMSLAKFIKLSIKR